MRQIVDAENKEVVSVDRLSTDKIGRDKIYAYAENSGIYRLMRDVMKDRWLWVWTTGPNMGVTDYESIADAINASRVAGNEVFEFDGPYEFLQWALRSTAVESTPYKFVASDYANLEPGS